MAFTEVKRERGRKKITLPSGAQIYIPVIISLTVRDQNGQETEHHYINTSEVANRETHVDQVTATPVDADGNPTSISGAPGSGNLAVERIDVWLGQDDIELAQESKFLLDNVTGNDTFPPRFTTHQKTHIYRYYQTPTSPDDNGVWVDSELIDEISVVDGNGQEWIYFLDNPFNEDTRSGDASGQANPDDPDISGPPDLDPPYQTDPFQNIVNFSGADSVVSVSWRYSFVTHSNPNTGSPVLGDPCPIGAPSTQAIPPGSTVICGSILNSTLLDLGDPLPINGGNASATRIVNQVGHVIAPGTEQYLSLPHPSITATVSYASFGFYMSVGWNPDNDVTFGGSGATVTGTANHFSTAESGPQAYYGNPIGAPGAWGTGLSAGGPPLHDDTGATVTCSLNASSATYSPPGAGTVHYESFATYIYFPRNGGHTTTLETTTAVFNLTAWFKVVGSPDPMITGTGPLPF